MIEGSSAAASDPDPGLHSVRRSTSRHCACSLLSFAVNGTVCRPGTHKAVRPETHLAHGRGFVVAAHVLLPRHVEPLRHHVPILLPPPLQDRFPAACSGSGWQCLDGPAQLQAYNPQGSRVQLSAGLSATVPVCRQACTQALGRPSRSPQLRHAELRAIRAPHAQPHHCRVCHLQPSPQLCSSTQQRYPSTLPCPHSGATETCPCASSDCLKAHSTRCPRCAPAVAVRREVAR